jgi:hypothetical protein
MGTNTEVFTPEIEPGEKPEKAAARALLNPVLNSACVAKRFSASNASEIELADYISALVDETKKCKKGDIERAKEMLAAQAHALDAMFSALALRAHQNMGDYLGATETYMKLALRAQSQSRATWEALASLSSTRITNNIAQFNASTAPQPVINRIVVHSASDENAPNELKESEHGEWLDARAAKKTSRSHPEMETLGALDGSAHGRR